MHYTARYWARFIFQSDWENWWFIWLDTMGLPWFWFLPVDFINNSSQDGKANYIHLQVGKTWRMVLWFFTHFLNLKLLFHSEFFVCEYLLFKFTLVVACVYIPNYDIISFEMVGFTNNNIIAWSQEVSYCDCSHHCASGYEGSTQTLNLCKQHKT